MPPERDRGAAEALGLVVLGPIMVGLAVLVMWSGRSVDLRAQLRTAAEAAAQSAALEVGSGAMRVAATETVQTMLGGATTACGAVWADTTSDGVIVEVVVSCAVDDAELPLTRNDADRDAGGPEVLTERAWATLDRYRAGRWP